MYGVRSIIEFFQELFGLDANIPWYDNSNQVSGDGDGIMGGKDGSQPEGDKVRRYGWNYAKVRFGNVECDSH